jgi:hypothetical protein
VYLHVACENAASTRFVALPAANVKPIKNAMPMANVSVTPHVARDNAALIRFVALPAANVRPMKNAMTTANVFPMILVSNGYEFQAEVSIWGLRMGTLMKCQFIL